MPAVANETAHQPLQSLIDDLWQGERQQAEEQTASMEALEEAMGVLDEWSQRLEAEQAKRDAEQEAAEQAREAERLELESYRKRIEQDLVAARERIADLQSSLQERTEELLKAQAANNDLAAELQTVKDALPLGAITASPTESAAESPNERTDEESADDSQESSEAKSVSERFGRLRKKKD